MKYLLDTCVVSEMRRAHPDENAWAWLSRRNPEDWYLSAVTIGELRSGARSARDISMRPVLAQWIDETVLPMFKGRILPLDEQTGDYWGRLHGDGVANGHTPSVSDSQIAATALAHGMAMVTRNVDDFQFDGLTVINPFEKEVAR